MKILLVKSINLIIRDWWRRRLVKRAEKLSCECDSLKASVRMYEATYNVKIIQDGGESDA